jgi:ribonuclease HI
MNMRQDPKPKVPEIDFFCDGSCLDNQNSGTGGWAAVLKYKDTQKIVRGCSEKTTNNRMELMAAIGGLKALNKKCRVRIFSDSQYLVSTMNNRWKKKANQDLWKELDDLTKKHNVEFIWVKGHSGLEKNEMANSIAIKEARKLKGEINGFRNESTRNDDTQEKI